MSGVAAALRHGWLRLQARTHPNYRSVVYQVRAFASKSGSSSSARMKNHFAGVMRESPLSAAFARFEERLPNGIPQSLQWLLTVGLSTVLTFSGLYTLYYCTGSIAAERGAGKELAAHAHRRAAERAAAEAAQASSDAPAEKSASRRDTV
mmetsp:Transcript_28755/g.52399  ORF Transcript_28755/g.52399 Transcript_28755/m.52399 type:complete len:150 (-) Transcript_28755:102-551(-)